MNYFSSRKDWDLHLQGWTITDVSARNSEAIHVATRKDLLEEETSLLFDDQIPTRIVSIDLDKQGKERFHVDDLGGFNHSFCGVSRSPIAQVLVVSREYHSEILAIGAGRPKALEKVATDGPAYLSKIRCLDAAGGLAYAVGTFRSVFRRVAHGRWERLPPVPGPLSSASNAVFVHGFNDIDAFSPTEIYAVGGHGEVFRFDGTTWHDCGFPTNRQLNTVTCAGDGQVYISGEGGRLWAGRGNRWVQVHDNDVSIPYNDVLWFAGELWLSSDYQLHIWDGQHIRTPTYPDASWPLSGHMDAVDGLLVVAGLYAVYAHDGREWRILVERPDP